MADIYISGQRGTTIGFRLTVTLEDGTPINCSLPSTSVKFTAKRRRSVAPAAGEPLVELTYRSPPDSSDANVTLVDGVTDNNVIEWDIPPEATDDYGQSEFLVCDAILTEPGGRTTTIAKGTLYVGAGVGV